MKIKNIFFLTACLIMATISQSCEDFVELDTPDFKLDRQTVFSNDASAQNVLNGIYNQLFNTSFSGGGAQSVTILAGLYADNVEFTGTNEELLQFDSNLIAPNNLSNQSLWAGAYNIIYQANSLITNVEGNELLSAPKRDHLVGSGKFIRAFTYFYLVNLYGDVPLIINTDYQENAIAGRAERELVYNRIIEDLESASQLLQDSYPDQDRTRLNRFAAMALLARVHLYQGNWEEAVTYSSALMNASQYRLLNNLNEIFLADSSEAIWQISPVGGGNSLTHTREGNLFIQTGSLSTPVALTAHFLNEFENTQDLRREAWVALFNEGEDSLYYPNKYKIQYDASGGAIEEYSMVMRLGEQYLIRAEAYARLNQLNEALVDLNVIRSRSGLEIINEVADQGGVLERILEERRRELFTEWGHRWLDLKRYGRSEQLKEQTNSSWTSTSILFPIPLSELQNNPNLDQNPGY